MTLAIESQKILAEIKHIKRRIEDSSPDWASIPMYKRPAAAMAFAEEQAELARELSDYVVKLVENFDKRLVEGGL